MYIIEKSNGTEAARWNNLHNPNWPDGASQSGRSQVGDSRVGEDGETYTIKAVLQKTEGDGPRTLGVASVKKVGDEWHQVTKMGAALPPPPTPKPGDNLYDHSSLRKREYEEDIPFGDQADAILKWTTAIRMKKSAVDDAIDGITSITDDDEKGALKTALGPIFDLPADLDSVIGKWLAVKAKFPKE